MQLTGLEDSIMLRGQKHQGKDRFLELIETKLLLLSLFFEEELYLIE